MNPKTLPATALVLVMLISGFAVAETDANAETEARVGTGIRDLTKVGATARTNVDVVLDTGSGPETDADSRKRVGEALRERNREVSAEIRERLQNARDNFQEQRQRIVESRLAYVDARARAHAQLGDFNELRERLHNARAEDKNMLREQLKSTSQRVLLNQVTAILHRLEAISGHENAPEDIGVSIEFFEGIKAKLESGELSREELIEISHEIRGFWKEEKVLLQKKIGVRLNNGINGIINKAETFSERISALIERLEAQGKDTTSLNEALDKLNADIETFKEVYAELKEELEEAETREDALSVLREAHSTLKRMNHQLLKDFRLMKALFKAVRELDASGEVSAETETELEDSVSEESELEDEAEEEEIDEEETEDEDEEEELEDESEEEGDEDE